METPTAPLFEGILEDIVKRLVATVVERVATDPDLRSVIDVRVREAFEEKAKATHDAMIDGLLHDDAFEEAVLTTIRENGSKLSEWVENCRHFKWLKELGSGSEPEEIEQAVADYLKGRKLTVSLSSVEMDIEEVGGD
jgi:hypothetical protein